jgi:hypothetical protein
MQRMTFERRWCVHDTTSFPCQFPPEVRLGQVGQVTHRVVLTPLNWFD